MDVGQVGSLKLKVTVDDHDVKPSLDKVSAAARKSSNEIPGYYRDAAGRLRDEKGRYAAAGTQLGDAAGRGIKNGAQPHLNDLRGKISGALSKAATVGLVGGTAAVAGVAGLATYGLKIAAANEQAMVSFTMLLGSAEKANAFYKQMVDFANHTPLQIAGLRDTASQLLSVGMSAEDIIPVLRGVGDLTSTKGAGQQEAIDSATRALNQMQLKGKIYAEEMMQLSEAGIPGWQLLADAMHTTTAAAQEAVKNGDISPQLLIDQLKSEQGSAFDKAGGGTLRNAMALQADTLAGKASTLKDTFDSMLGQAMAPLAQTLKQLLGPLTDAVGSFIEGMQPAFTSLGDMIAAMAPLLKPLGTLLGTLGKALMGVLATAFKALVPVIEKLAPVLGRVIEALGAGLTKVIEHLAPYLPQFADNMVMLLDALIPLIPFVADLVVQLEPWIQMAIEIQSAMAPLVVQLLNILTQSGLLEQFTELVGQFVTMLATMGRDTMMSLIQLLIDLMPLIVEVLTVMIEFQKAIWDVYSAIIDALSAAWTWIVGFFNNFSGYMQGLGKTILDALVWPFKTAANIIIGLVNKVIEAWNGVSFTMPEISSPWGQTFGGFDFGVPQISPIPALANGGIVTRPTLALIGEAGPEAVVPLSRGGGVGTNVTVNVNVAPGGVGDPRTIKEAARQAVNETLRGGALRLVAAGR